MKNQLRVNHLNAYYDRQILYDINFLIQEQQLVALVGPNGCGKSTLLKAIMGVISTKGEVYVGDLLLHDMNVKQKAQYVSVLTQRFDVMNGIWVSEILKLGKYARSNFFDHVDDEEIRKVAQHFHIENFLEQDYAFLSEGQKQLVQLARSMIQDTPILLLDEPDSALDQQHRQMLYRYLKDMIFNEKKAGLIVLHDLVSALNHCHRILLMKDGRFIDEINPLEETIDMINEKIKKIYPYLLIKKDVETKQYYSLTGEKKSEK